MIKRAFTEHPESVGETYFQHMGMAFGFGGKMVISGAACLLHGLFPFLFKCTGRKCIEELHHRMVTNRVARACDDESLPSIERKTECLQAAE
ncbi:DUF6356 family protein [Hyphococcus sp.]|uniref:DUF6356 family protein n=1 Tax=Hyphococcus sp. TaxID=2038636 RepID=UPI003CCBD358